MEIGLSIVKKNLSLLVEMSIPFIKEETALLPKSNFSKFLGYIEFKMAQHLMTSKPQFERIRQI